MQADAYRNSQWSKSSIEKKIKAIRLKHWNMVGGAYGPEETECLYDTINFYKGEVFNKSVLVIGSETPWVESILLAIGAKHVTTLEYNRIQTTHPMVSKTTTTSTKAN